MEIFKMLFYASLTLIAITVGIFFIGTLLINLMGIAFVLTYQHAVGAMIAMLCLKYLIQFLLVTPSPQTDITLLENENDYLKDTNLGLTMILGAIIKYHGGEIKLPTYMVSQVTEKVEVTHVSDYVNHLEVFTVIDEGDLITNESKLN